MAAGPLGGSLSGVIGEGARDVRGVAHAWVLPVQKLGVLAALTACLALGILELSWRLEMVDLDGRDAAHSQCEDCALHCWRNDAVKRDLTKMMHVLCRTTSNILVRSNYTGMGGSCVRGLASSRINLDDNPEKKKFSIVATDLDGTFMREDGRPPWNQVPSSVNVNAAKALIEKGIYFVPLSGRMIANMTPLVHAMGQSVSSSPLCRIGGYNGGVLVEPSADPNQPWREIYCNSLSNKAIESAVATATKHDLLMKVYYRDEMGRCCLTSSGDFEYAEHQAEFFFGCGEFPYSSSDAGSASLNETLRQQLGDAPFPISRIPRDANVIAALKPQKIVVLTNVPTSMMESAHKDLMAGEADLVRGYFWFEYMPPAINKSTGLAWFAESVGLTIDDCVAFGDSSNDLEMLRDAGLGIAMANARDDVKAIAAHVSPYTNDEDGVGQEIERLIEEGQFADHEWPWGCP